MIAGRLARLLILLLVLLAGSWGFLFSLANAEPVALDLILIRLPEATVATWVLVAFGLGGLCGLAAGSGALWRMRRARSRAPGTTDARGPQAPGS